MIRRRNDWIAARRCGSRVGWYGAPEIGGDPVSAARPRELDTIVATSRPEGGFQMLIEQLVEGGRLLLALPFGEPYPSALVDELRAVTVPIELELIDGELRLAVEKRSPTVASWQMFAAPGRLLVMTERGARERDGRRAAELGLLRSAYQRLAERLMHRAADRAGPELAAASRVLALEDRVADLAERLRSIDEAPDAQIGRALLLAARSPREAVRLPARLLRALVDSRHAPPALPPPPPADRELVSLVRRSRDRLALIVDGRRFEQASGLERELSMEGWGVILAASRESNEMRAAQRILHLEIELLEDLIATVERADAAERIAIFRTPHPVAPRWINRLNAWGWVTLYDCFEDWPAALRLAQPHRYRRSVERFLVHNADLVCATRACADRLRELGSPAPILIEDWSASGRARALIEAARTIKWPARPEKSLHARELG